MLNTERRKSSIAVCKMSRRSQKFIQTALFLFLGVCLSHTVSGQSLGNSLDLWQTERPRDMANIADLQVMCGKQHMEVEVTFDKPFNGIIFSKGAVDQYECIYVKPQTGLNKYKFDILYDRCGSRPDLNGKFYENNIVIQYDQDLIEVWDEAKRLRCEWYNDYEKGVTKPPIRVSDLEVVELNFRGDNVDCWMEIQQGKGPWASPVNGIVPLGTTLTMVVGIDDKEGEFDMRVKSCEASDNKNRPIELSDENGCVLRPKMVSKFHKMRSTDPRATVVTYAFFHAFKFPDSMAVHIRCKVEICRFGCPEHCQNPSNYVAREQEVSSSIYNNNNNYEAPQAQYDSPSAPTQVYTQSAHPPPPPPPPPVPGPFRQNYQQNAPHQPPRGKQGKRQLPGPGGPPPVPKNYQVDPRGKKPQKVAEDLPRPLPLVADKEEVRSQEGLRHHARAADTSSDEMGEAKQSGAATSGFPNFLGLKLPELPQLPSFPFFGKKAESKADSKVEPNGEAITVPLGVIPDLKLKTDERVLSEVPVHRTNNKEQPLVFPSSFDTAELRVEPLEEVHNHGSFPYGPRALQVEALERPIQRRRRSVGKILSRKERSTELGVKSGYEVVSEVDLDFSPGEEGPNQERVTVFQGRMREEVVYGVCLPVTGFSALFVLFALMTVVSVIVAGFVCYHRQLAKVSEEGAPEPSRVMPVPVQAGRHEYGAGGLEAAKDWGINTWFRNKQNNLPGGY